MANLERRQDINHAKAVEWSSKSSYEEALLPVLRKRIANRHNPDSERSNRFGQQSEVMDPIVLNLPPSTIERAPNGSRITAVPQPPTFRGNQFEQPPNIDGMPTLTGYMHPEVKQKK